MFALPIFFAVLQLLLFFTCYGYETPAYYKQRGMTAELETFMRKMYSADQVQDRIDELNTAGLKKNLSWGEALCGSRYKKALLVGCTLSFTQQFSGINAILQYLPNILNNIDKDST